MSNLIRFMLLILFSIGASGCSDHTKLTDNFVARSVNVNGTDVRASAFDQ